MTQETKAWMRYANEPDILYGLVYELGREIERSPELADWCRQQIREIVEHTDGKAA